MAPILDPKTAQKFEPNDPKVAEFVTWVSANEREFWLTYLVVLGLNAHLARFLPGSPFTRGTHLDRRIHQLIHQFLPDLNALEQGNFLFAAQAYVRDHKLICKEFDYKEPP